MKCKKTTLFITAVLALMLCFSFGVAADPQMNEEDEVSVLVPGLEQYLDFPTISTVTVSDRHTGSYYVAAVSWDPFGDQYVYPEKEYTIAVTVEAAENNVFTDTVKAYVNGKPATIITKSTEEVKFFYKFPALKATPPAMFFSDVLAKDWFYKDVEFVYYNRLMQGVGGDRFDPKGTTTRSQIVTILYRMEGSPGVSEPCTFQDVPVGKWYTDAIIWAAKNEIVKGYDKNRFGPNDDITREQMAKIFCNYAKFKGLYDENDSAMLAGFKDEASISSWAHSDAAWAVGVGLITGVPKSDGIYFCPKDKADRSQAAAIFHRFCENFNITF